jgi:type VI secretion system secreted protein VgrG
MSAFDDALKLVLSNEGAFVDNPNDAGGATLRGVSLRFLRQISSENLRKYGIFETGNAITIDVLKALTDEQISAIYKGEFWEKAPFDQIEEPLCNYVFDSAVNHGISPAIKILQRSVWAYQNIINFIDDDGILGEVTLKAINDTHSFILLDIMMSERAGYMRTVAAANSKDKEFLNGWLNRAYRI